MDYLQGADPAWKWTEHALTYCSPHCQAEQVSASFPSRDCVQGAHSWSAAVSADVEELQARHLLDWLSCLLISAFPHHLHWLPFFPTISQRVVLRVPLFALSFPSLLSLACILLVNYLGRQPFIQQNWLHSLQVHSSFKKKESGFPLGGHIPVGRRHADQQKWFNFNQIHAPRQGLAWAGSLHVPEARTSASPNVSSSSPPPCTPHFG